MESFFFGFFYFSLGLYSFLISINKAQFTWFKKNVSYEDWLTKHKGLLKINGLILILTGVILMIFSLI